MHRCIRNLHRIRRRDPLDTAANFSVIFALVVIGGALIAVFYGAVVLATVLLFEPERGNGQ